MTWNYRIIKHADHVSLHEVFYDDDGSVNGWTARPISFVNDDAEGLIKDLERALNDARDRPILVI